MPVNKDYRYCLQTFQHENYVTISLVWYQGSVTNEKNENFIVNTHKA